MSQAFFISMACVLINSCSNISLSKFSLGKLQPRGIKPSGQVFAPAWTLNSDPSTYQSGNLPIALTSPVIKDGILHLGDGDGYMGAYDLERGRKIWRVLDGGDYHAPPAYYQRNILYGTSEGRFISRNATTGKLNYIVDVGAAISSRPFIYRDRAYIQLRNHTVVCIDAKVGKLLWAYRRSVPVVTTVQRTSTPVVHKGKLYVGFADGSVVSLSVEEGIVFWEKTIAVGKRFVDVDTTPVFFAGLLVMGSAGGQVTLLDPKDGRIVRKLKHSIVRAPLVVDGNMIMGTDSGDVVVYNKSLSLVRKVKVSSHGIGPMSLWRKSLVVASWLGELTLVDLSTWKVQENFIFGHRSSNVFGEMAVSEGRLAVLSARNRLYVFN